jgi:hypothetical protein
MESQPATKARPEGSWRRDIVKVDIEDWEKILKILYAFEAAKATAQSRLDESMAKALKALETR